MLSIIMSEYYQNNREQKIEYQLNYYYTNKKKIRMKQNDYYRNVYYPSKKLVFFKKIQKIEGGLIIKQNVTVNF